MLENNFCVHTNISQPLNPTRRIYIVAETENKNKIY